LETSVSEGDAMAEDGRPARQERLRVLVSEAALARHVDVLASAITRDVPATETLVVVGVLKGSLVFLADVIRRLPMPIEVELVETKRAAGADRHEPVRVLDDLEALPVAGRNVLLLDCVLNSGRTLEVLRSGLWALGPASLRTCVLLRKARRDAVGPPPDYVGQEIPDTFVVGYGLDHANRWRHLPYVAELLEDPVRE